MTSSVSNDDLSALGAFCDQLMTYRELVEACNASTERPSSFRGDMEKLRLELLRQSGRTKPLVVGITGKRLFTQWLQTFDIWDGALGSSVELSHRLTCLNLLTDSVNEALGRMETGPTASPSPFPFRASPRAFVAHGGDSKALGKLEEFLRALGVDPLVVEDQASEDRSANGNVEHYLSQADCAIVLATKGDIDGRTGEFLPRGNILIELGRCQERFPRKTVWLLEEDTKFPSNVSEKVWERFSHDNMERAFIKIVKELSAFGIVKTGKPGK
jgi:predicted nucleotide-binding protein